MDVEHILSDRLILIPFSLDLATSILNKNLEVLERLGLKVNNNWPDAETIEVIPKIIKSLELDKQPKGFNAWMFVKQVSMTVIGDGGFKGKPNDHGEIDIGYSILKEERNNGYGFEGVKRLVEWAFLQDEVKAITASCLINNAASKRILEKLGMHETSRDTEMIYWKISKE